MGPVVYWEDVEVGQDLPSIVKRPTTRQLAQYAGASGDFYEVHYDDAFARAAGLPGVIVHGALKSAFLAQLVTDWIGDEGSLTRLGVQYRGMDMPGDALTCGGRVTKKYVEEGVCYVTCALWLENGAGERTTSGAATAILPSRVPAA